MTEAVTALISAVPAIAKAVTALAGSSDAAARREQLTDLQQALIQLSTNAFAVQVQNASLLTRVSELEGELTRSKDWAAEKAQYALLEVSAGIFARVQQSSVQPLQQAHKLCSTCFERGVKSFLQIQTGELRRRNLLCPACKTVLVLHGNSFVDGS